MKAQSSKKTEGMDCDSATTALEWLVRLQDVDWDPEEPYPDMEERQRVFLQWLRRSPEHVREFLEAMELERRVSHPDPQRLIQVQELLENSSANVVSLHQPPSQPTAAATETSYSFFNRRRLLLSGTLAAAASAAAVLFFMFIPQGPHVYSTGVGEQRTFKLQDDSIVALNTDSRIEIDFSDHARHVRLVHGEALFIVEHDTHRSFTVVAGGTQVRAIGTQFDVRRRSHSTVVAVVEGTVQVSTGPATYEDPAEMKSEMPQLTGAKKTMAARAAPTTLKLVAGEKVQVTHGAMTATPSHGDDVLSWRQRRLVFRDTPLTEVADEFNRFNRTQIQVADAAAGQMQITGTFDADRPQAILLFAQKHPSLLTEPDGSHWIIRSRR